MSIKSNTPSPVGRATKGKRVAFIVRIPVELLAKLDERSAADDVARNDVVMDAIAAHLIGKSKPVAASPRPTPAPSPSRAAAASVPGTRLDKTQIGRRLTPKPKPGAKAAPAPVEEEAV